MAITVYNFNEVIYVSLYKKYAVQLGFLFYLASSLVFFLEYLDIEIVCLI